MKISMTKIKRALSVMFLKRAETASSLGNISRAGVKDTTEVFGL